MNYTKEFGWSGKWDSVLLRYTWSL